jgi:hypothetical protein
MITNAAISLFLRKLEAFWGDGKKNLGGADRSRTDE